MSSTPTDHLNDAPDGTGGKRAVTVTSLDSGHGGKVVLDQHDPGVPSRGAPEADAAADAPAQRAAPPSQRAETARIDNEDHELDRDENHDR